MSVNMIFALLNIIFYMFLYYLADKNMPWHSFLSLFWLFYVNHCQFTCSDIRLKPLWLYMITQNVALSSGTSTRKILNCLIIGLLLARPTTFQIASGASGFSFKLLVSSELANQKRQLSWILSRNARSYHLWKSLLSYSWNSNTSPIIGEIYYNGLFTWQNW